MRWIVGISVALLVVFSQLATWGSYSLEIRWLQLRDLTGTASVSSTERMGAICLELKKYRCVEYTYFRQAQIDKSRTRKLAEYLLSRNKFKEAALALKSYLKDGKKDTLAIMLYARALSQTGQIDEATQYYERVIAMQARTLQPQVIKNYVTDLARAKRYTQAQAVILRMRRNHARSGRFMEQELRLLDATNYGRQTASAK